MQLRGRRDVEHLEQCLDLGAHLCGLPDAGLAAVVLDHLYLLQARDDVAPRVPGTDLGDACEQQGEYRDGHVRLDAPGTPVKDRSHAQPRLHLAPALLDAQKLLVAEREVLGGERVVVGGDDPLAVVALCLLDGAAVDAEPTACELPEVLAIAGTGDQFAGPLGVPVCLGLLHRRQLRRQVGDELRAVFALPRLLGRVVTDDVALSPFAVAEDDLLDAQVVAHLLVAARAREHLRADLVAGTHARAQDVLAAPERQGATVVGGVHPGVANERSAPAAIRAGPACPSRWSSRRWSGPTGPPSRLPSAFLR